MGRDKALLPYEGSTLAGTIATRVREAAGNVTLIGDTAHASQPGFGVQADLIASCGPMGGVYTALNITQADWNLIVACDMPRVTAAFMLGLFAAAEEFDADALVPATGDKLHPLCAVYHRRVLGAVEESLARRSLKMHDLLSRIHLVRWPVTAAEIMKNVNTPADWTV